MIIAEHYSTLLSLSDQIKTALDFYANPKNYRPQETRGGKHKSKIEIDGGVQARKVLERNGK